MSSSAPAASTASTALPYSDAATIPANTPTNPPATLASYDARQAQPYAATEAAYDPCRERAGYASADRVDHASYVVPAYARRSNVRTVRTRVVEPRPVVYEERGVVRRGRSTKNSVAIVAGSAGVGAAIGAIAGGGKGAGIGAIAGGAGGFTYDRLTHNGR